MRDFICQEITHFQISLKKLNVLNLFINDKTKFIYIYILKYLSDNGNVDYTFNYIIKHVFFDLLFKLK